MTRVGDLCSSVMVLGGELLRKPKSSKYLHSLAHPPPGYGGGGVPRHGAGHLQPGPGCLHHGALRVEPHLGQGVDDELGRDVHLAGQVLSPAPVHPLLAPCHSAQSAGSVLFFKNCF